MQPKQVIISRRYCIFLPSPRSGWKKTPLLENGVYAKHSGSFAMAITRECYPVFHQLAHCKEQLRAGPLERWCAIYYWVVSNWSLKTIDELRNVWFCNILFLWEDGVLIKFLLLQACTDCIAYKCLYEQEAFFPSFFLIMTFLEKKNNKTLIGKNKTQMPRYLSCHWRSRNVTTPKTICICCRLQLRFWLG